MAVGTIGMPFIVRAILIPDCYGAVIDCPYRYSYAVAFLDKGEGQYAIVKYDLKTEERNIRATGGMLPSEGVFVPRHPTSARTKDTFSP
jgi:hypothetical protein